ncbi:MAG: phage tail tube protein [Pirellulales bacterium]
MALKLGFEGKAYRNSATYATPTWNEIPNVRDLTLSVEKGEADVTTRIANGWKLSKGALKEASIEFEMLWDSGDTDFIALRDSFLNNTPIDMLILDGAENAAGSQGLRAICDVIGFTREEPLAEAMKVKVTVKPTYDATNGPTWYTAS